jgi:peptidoglycan hydrolase-like protein with peptidoglycan-binding domain
MRALTKALVTVTTAVGIAVGGLATAGTAMAAPAPAQQQTTSAEAVAPLAVVNLGLSMEQAKNLQRILKRDWRYTGEIDGIAGSGTKAAFKRFANDMAS